MSIFYTHFHIPDNFQKVIGQSGSALAGWAFDSEPEKHAKEIAYTIR